jgi:RNA polymerase sigma-70 factor (ECF subfamily)
VRSRLSRARTKLAAELAAGRGQMKDGRTPVARPIQEGNQ